MRLPHIPRAQELDIALIGIPYDGGTTYRPGPRFGPRHVREQSVIIRPWNPVLNLNPFENFALPITATFRSTRFPSKIRFSELLHSWMTFCRQAREPHV